MFELTALDWPSWSESEAIASPLDRLRSLIIRLDLPKQPLGRMTRSAHFAPSTRRSSRQGNANLTCPAKLMSRSGCQLELSPWAAQQ